MASEKPLAALVKTHCKHGHELTESNVYHHPSGQRVCKQCRLVSIRQYNKTHPESVGKWKREWARQNYPRRSQDPLFIERRKRNKRTYYLRHTERLSQENKGRYGALRLQVLDGYGGKCLSCGFTDQRALQIDHVNGGGTEERKDGRHSGYMLYRQLIEAQYPAEYQLLCANCNAIKADEQKEVPHYVSRN